MEIPFRQTSGQYAEVSFVPDNEDIVLTTLTVVREVVLPISSRIFTPILPRNVPGKAAGHQTLRQLLPSLSKVHVIENGSRRLLGRLFW